MDKKASAGGDVNTIRELAGAKKDIAEQVRRKRTGKAALEKIIAERDAEIRRLQEVERAAKAAYEALERLMRASAEVLVRDVQYNRSDAAFAELNMAALNASTVLEAK